MHLLLCAATETEIQPTLQQLSLQPTLSISVLITGVGLTATAYSLTKKISEKKPDLVIQAGICGSLNDNLQPGDVVAVKSEIIGDAGVQQNGAFHSLFKLHLCQPDQAPWAEERLTNPYPLLNECSWPLVNAVSVNEISTDLSRIDYYKSVLDAQIESMEGAALHYVCLMEKIPFLQLRSVSNKIAERDKQKWKVNLAIENLNRALLSLIKQVAHEN